MFDGTDGGKGGMPWIFLMEFQQGRVVLLDFYTSWIS